MENILKCRFMRIVLRGKKHDYDPNYLLAAFEDFRSLLLATSDGYQDYRDKFRTMQNIHRLLKLHIQNEKFQCEHGENIKSFAAIALSLVSVEVDLLDKQIQYPDLFPLMSKEPQRSPLHWNTSAFTKRDLIELVAAMVDIEAILDANGKPISFSHLLQQVSTLFNITINTKNAYSERDYMRNVRHDSVEFTRRLHEGKRKKSK